MKIVTYPAGGVDRAADALGIVGVPTLRQVRDVATARRVPMDALLLLGGSDVHPWLYGEPITHARHIDQHRDQVEWALTRRALAERVPILGICRGSQLLTVACGGALHQDIYRDAGYTHPSGYRVEHKLAKIAAPLKERLPVDQSDGQVWVNSRHHQAIKTPPPGFRVVARAADTTIEAIWRPGLLGVQWHPEDLVDRDPRWLGLFSWFVDGLAAPTS